MGKTYLYEKDDIGMIEQYEIPEFHPGAKLYLVTYLSRGLKLKGYIAVPRGKGPHPLMVYCRGGIKNVGMTKLAWIEEFVERGYMVFAPFYRGNRGGEGREDFAGEDRYDVIDALPWLANHDLVDNKNIHLFGFSRGSLMALFAAMESHHVRSVIVWGGVSDLTLTYEERVDLRRMLKRVAGGTPGKVPQSYRYRTPLHRINELNCPVLIIHGAEDQQVGVEHAYRLAAALHEAGKHYTLRIYQGLGHHFPPPQKEKACELMFRWIKSID